MTAITPSHPSRVILESPAGIAIISRMPVTNPSINSRIGLKKYLKLAPSLLLARIDAATLPAHVVTPVSSGTAKTSVACPWKILASTTQAANSIAINQPRLSFFGFAINIVSFVLLIRGCRLQQVARNHVG